MPVTVKFTVVAVLLGFVRLIVNCPLSLGSVAVGSLAVIDTVAVSCVSLIVTMAVRSAASESRKICESPLTLVSVTITVSSPSTSVSASNAMFRVTDVAKAGMTTLVPSEV